MAVLTIGDIGVVSGMMHIGDEAMFEAARDELAARSVDIVGVSSAPAESERRYGVPMVPRLGFAGRVAGTLGGADGCRGGAGLPSSGRSRSAGAGPARRGVGRA